MSKEESLNIYKDSLNRYEVYVEELKKEKQVLETIVEKIGQDNTKTAKIYFEKDAEIDFLQKEISSLMQEKYDKESIIKSKIVSIIIIQL